MKANRKNNRRANIFEAYSVSELEPFARAEYDRLATEPKPVGHYWLLQECLRQLEMKKGLAPEDWSPYLTETLGFDPEPLAKAKTIHDNYATMDRLSGVTMEEALGLKGESEPRNQEEIVSGGKTTNVTGLRLLSEVSPRPVEWLWAGYIPFGEVTLAEGDPGANKSSMLCDLAARLSQGRDMPWPASGRSQAQQGGTLILAGEDSVAKTVRGRLLAAGADLSRVGILDDVAIPDDMLTIHKAIQEIGAKLVVVDTLNDFLRCNVQGNQQVRGALRPLRHLAETANVAVVMLRHLVKSGSGRSLLRGGGSVGITAMARSQLKVCRHPDDPQLRVLLQDKSSLGPLSPSLLFEVVADETNNSFRLEWHGECDLTIEDLERKEKGTPTVAAAERFLLEKLATGPQEVNRLVEQARGICSKRTLDEAKRSLGIKTVRKGKGKNHKVSWSL